MQGYQNIEIIGNVGQDAKFEYTRDGVAMCKFSVAVNRKIGTGDKRREITTWFNCVLWRQLAEAVGGYVKKGSIVFVTGSVNFSAYIDKSGNAAGSLELNVEKIQLLGGNGNNDRNHNRNTDNPDDSPDGDHSDEIPF